MTVGTSTLAPSAAAAASAEPDIVAPTAPADASEFDLDVSIVESGPVIAGLLNNTDDGCGSTCESACTSCE